MPFGSHPFQDGYAAREAAREAGYVTNAFRQSSVSGPVPRGDTVTSQVASPMPFGSHPFQDVRQKKDTCKG